MLIASAAILIGFIVLVWSADLFVAGAASMAENMGMSPILIGLTIVSLGTSAPEVLVAITAAMSDVGELAIGNAIGSNIANVGLVLGLTALIAPLPVHRARLRRELPTLMAITIACGLLLLDGKLDLLDGLLMLGALAFILFEMINSQSHDPDANEEAGVEDLPHMQPVRAWVSFIIGLVLLIASSKLLVWGASKVAIELGVSQLVIGLTIVAIGTSLPELAATMASALKGHGEIALGNVVGSNIFNLLGVMSLPGMFAVEYLEPMVLIRDYASMTGITLLLAAVLYLSLLRPKCRNEGGNIHVGRSIGALLLAAYALYYYFLYLTA
ncbi:calcium/sodium antiporter [Halieaceae bacterium IMCC14734]|uniref:Calcium/sodium antiporter n=1 Tax=Candidatus Litorirhabdus singularis TaxID=2518993 RepID=A0ABT3TJF9_9GAMM|nr:calcium/sodium antiporter [Candidatus Litorirhabdus singularis]MCX2982452.1 calcium/sodium antiporter [Candidatus Litorirhabdus singularis]